MPKQVWVLYYDGNDFHWKELMTLDPTSTDPEDYGLKDDYMIQLVIASFRGGNVYLDGRLVGEAFGR